MSSTKGIIIKKSKSKVKTKHQKHFKTVHQKVKLFRASEPLLSVFMWGVNHTVTELIHVPLPVMLLSEDFKAYSKTKVDNHGFNKENMPSHYKVKEYCPNVFRNLRERFGVEEFDYLKSLSKYQPQPMEPSGRSNARLFLSYDQRFVIKTLTAEEVAEMHSVLKQYHEYVVEKHGRTLLPQYLGLYRLTVEGTETYLIVMRHIFGRRYKIHKKYDLKGSTVQRQASEKEKSKDLPTFKDNDFVDEGCKLALPDDAREKLLEMLKCDVDFLAKLHLMDYSLLVGIHDLKRSSEEGTTAPDAGAVRTEEDDDPDEEAVLGTSPPGQGDSSGPDVVSEDEFQPTPPDSPDPARGAFRLLSGGSTVDLTDEFYAIPAKSDAESQAVYFMGLVDILTYYGAKKKTASAVKSVKYGSEAEISTVKPEQYAKRLLDFVTKALE